MSNLLYEKLYMGIVYDAMRLLGYKDDDFYINIKPKNILMQKK